MTGKDVAEAFWRMLQKHGFQVMDNVWDAADPKLQSAWNEYARELSLTKPGMGQYNTDDWIQLVLDWPEDARQRLYMLLNAAGHRVR